MPLQSPCKAAILEGSYRPKGKKPVLCALLEMQVKRVFLIFSRKFELVVLRLRRKIKALVNGLRKNRN
jgi:hypothetical protein